MNITKMYQIHWLIVRQDYQNILPSKIDFFVMNIVHTQFLLLVFFHFRSITSIFYTYMYNFTLLLFVCFNIAVICLFLHCCYLFVLTLLLFVCFYIAVICCCFSGIRCTYGTISSLVLASMSEIIIKILVEILLPMQPL